MRKLRKCALAAAALLGVVVAAAASAPEIKTFPDATGVLATHMLDGAPLDLNGIFFQPLSPNGRSCSSCHRPAQAWTVSADEIKKRFEDSGGLDPIFAAKDGANCDHGINTSTFKGRRSAFSLLIDRGLIRMTLPAPADAEFEVTAVHNPYGCDDPKMLSLYRRPLPATNLRLLSSVMWDGRDSAVETGTRLISAATHLEDLTADLAHQAFEAVSTHAMATVPLTAEQQKAIVRFELDTVTAQAVDREAGPLDGAGGKGGPQTLAERTIPSFYIGINDPQGGNPHSIKPENGFRLFDDWSRQPYGRVYVNVPTDGDDQTRYRDSVSRGQVLFNQKPFNIRGVAGFNDAQHLPSVTGACGSCHNSVNAGNRSVAAFMNTGAGETRSSLDVSYLPLITVRNKSTGETVTTTDPGSALISGKWKDIGTFKVPVLRGLAARAPYFHNGSARSLREVVDFYDQRFQIGLSARDKADLIAFLASL